MTYKITIWDEKKSTGMVRDYRLPVWGGIVCRPHAMNKICGRRPWFIEIEGDIPEEIYYGDLRQIHHPLAPKENITLKGRIV